MPSYLRGAPLEVYRALQAQKRLSSATQDQLHIVPRAYCPEYQECVVFGQHTLNRCSDGINSRGFPMCSFSIDPSHRLCVVFFSSNILREQYPVLPDGFTRGTVASFPAVRCSDPIAQPYADKFREACRVRQQSLMPLWLYMRERLPARLNSTSWFALPSMSHCTPWNYTMHTPLRLIREGCKPLLGDVAAILHSNGATGYVRVDFEGATTGVRIEGKICEEFHPKAETDDDEALQSSLFSQTAIDLNAPPTKANRRAVSAGSVGGGCGMLRLSQMCLMKRTPQAVGGLSWRFSASSRSGGSCKGYHSRRPREEPIDSETFLRWYERNLMQDIADRKARKLGVVGQPPRPRERFPFVRNRYAPVGCDSASPCVESKTAPETKAPLAKRAFTAKPNRSPSSLRNPNTSALGPLTRVLVAPNGWAGKLLALPDASQVITAKVLRRGSTPL